MKQTGLDRPKNCCSSDACAFTLVELLVSISILAVIVFLLVDIMSGTQRSWTMARERTTEYREARTAFESLSHRLSLATLNAYWGYKLSVRGVPTNFERESELHFVSGPALQLLSGIPSTAGHAVFFQAPLDITENRVPTGSLPDINRAHELINGWGYYVTYGSDLSARPTFLVTDTVRNPERKRFRLMEFRMPTERLNLYRPTSTSSSQPWIEAQTSMSQLYSWFGSTAATYSQPLAENVLALLIEPVVPAYLASTGANNDIAPDFQYDTRRHQWTTDSRSKISRHQLPPELRLTLICLEESSWKALSTQAQDAAGTELLGLLRETWFKSATNFDTDMEALKAKLLALKLRYRIFSTAIPVQEARWITENNS